MAHTRGRSIPQAIQNKALAGIITDGDIRRSLQDANQDVNKSVNSIMNRTPEIANATTPLWHVLKQMERKRITEIIITDGNSQPIGYLSLHDLLHLKMPTDNHKNDLIEIENFEKPDLKMQNA